jgi:hypothetical protein
MIAKSSSVASIIRHDADPKELDATILLSLIADKFWSGDLIEHPSLSLILINALLAKEPNFYSGYKLKLYLLIASTLNKEESSIVDFFTTYKIAKKFDSTDPELLELALAQRGGLFRESEEDNTQAKDYREFIRYIDKQISKFPQEWIYPYYKANAIYNGGKGNYEATMAIMEAALKLAPNESRLRQTLENLKSDEENKRIHPFLLTIEFNLNDL